jgi:hypothetical protein
MRTGRACATDERNERYIRNFIREPQRKKPLAQPILYRGIMLKLVLEKCGMMI